MKLLNRFLNKNNLKKYNKIADKIDAYFEKHTLTKTVPELKEALAALRANTKMSNDEKTVQAIAIGKSASRQVLGMSYYRVQLLGGMALIDGNMAEMKTGEGKTLTCSVATIANFALGFKTHVVTANEYLTTRDEETLRPLYAALGISSSAVVANQQPEEKRQAYACEIVYSTANELGFDYLRDNLVQNISEKVQPLNFKEVKIIIDEADFVLIDEATTPLIISGQKPLKDLDFYHKLREVLADFQPVTLDPNASRLVIDSFVPDGEFWLDKKNKRTFLSDIGYDTVETRLKEVGILPNEEQVSLYDDSYSWLVNEVCQCLNATWIYERDKDYVVLDDEIVIVDPNTGRLSQGRSWSNGLHQAIQAKEQITIKPENTTTGTITVQNYLKIYNQISGMSGTIMQSTEEFEQIYSCSTISIPPNRPSRRIDEVDQIYPTAEGKYAAMLEEIKRVHATGQPILVGTVSVAESEMVSDLLQKAGVRHQVINANNHALEAKIIAQAGQKGKVTVATSMAGRGTDIILGGNKEAISEAILQDFSHLSERIEFAKFIIEDQFGGITMELNQESLKANINLDYTLNNEHIEKFYNTEYIHQRAGEDPQQLLQDLYQIHYNLNAQLENIQQQWAKMKQEVLDLNGLCVIGSSRNVSRRIDNQLMGRAGRQGDPGRSIFFMSIEDPWLEIFGNINMLKRVTSALPTNEPIDSGMVIRAFTKAQNAAEGQNFEFRKSTFQYDSVADQGRTAFFEIRDKFLLNKSEELEIVLKNTLYDRLVPCTNPVFDNYLEDVFKETVSDGMGFIKEKKISVPELVKLVQEFPKHESYGLYVPQDNNPHDADLISIVEEFIGNPESRAKEENDLQKFAFTYASAKAISTLDDYWCDHLTYLETSRKSVGYVSLVQKNPLHEFRKLCFESFSFLYNNFCEKSLDDFLDGFSNRDSIFAEIERQQREYNLKLQQHHLDEANRLAQAEEKSLLISNDNEEIKGLYRHEFTEEELIEQPEAQHLNSIRMTGHQLQSASPFDTVNNVIRENQRNRLAEGFGLTNTNDLVENSLDTNVVTDNNATNNMDNESPVIEETPLVMETNPEPVNEAIEVQELPVVMETQAEVLMQEPITEINPTLPELVIPTDNNPQDNEITANEPSKA